MIKTWQALLVSVIMFFFVTPPVGIVTDTVLSEIPHPASSWIIVCFPIVYGLLVGYVSYIACVTRPAMDDGIFCVKCGYDLTGNVSGRCPECGRPISLRVRDRCNRR